jgi:hypothetical protein
MTACEPDRLQGRSLPILLLLPGRGPHPHPCCLSPTVSLATFEGLNATQLKRLQRIVEEHSDEIHAAWRRHFRR